MRRIEGVAMENRAKEVVDYGRSFVTFVTPERGNNARLQIESKTTLRRSGADPLEYYFFASCKSEDTYGTGDLFHEDNYDFCGMFSADEYAIYRTKSTHDVGYVESGLWADRFDDVNWHIRTSMAHEAQVGEDIVAATLTGKVLAGCVEWEESGNHWTIEFPIKTMNVNDQRMVWQVDTGPVGFPIARSDGDGRLIERLRPAYVAYNNNQKADFIVQGPMTVRDIEITHYHDRLRVEGRTHIYIV